MGGNTYYMRTFYGHKIITYSKCEYRGIVDGGHEFFHVRKNPDREFTSRIGAKAVMIVSENIEDLFDCYVVQSNSEPKKVSVHHNFVSALNAADLNGLFGGECSIYGAFWTHRGLGFVARLTGDLSNLPGIRSWSTAV